MARVLPQLGEPQSQEADGEDQGVGHQFGHGGHKERVQHAFDFIFAARSLLLFAGCFNRPFILDCMAQRLGLGRSPGAWMTSGFRRPLIPAAALCAFTVAAAGCAPVADQTIGPESQQDNRSVQVAMPVPKPVATERIVIIGDSLSTGYGTSPEEAWPRLLSDDLHSVQVPVEVINAAMNGAGYIAVGDEEATFQTQIKGSINASTDVVVFFGSDNDAGQDPAELHAAVMDALQTTKTLAPHAKRVVIGPLPAFDSAASDIDIIRDQERMAALDVGVEFVDPVAEHWIPGPDSALLGPDGEHPSSEGQQFLKGKIKATLGEPRDRPV